MRADHPINTDWSGPIAYAVGLVASDGCVRRDGRHVVFTSQDKELVEKYKKALGVKNKISVALDRDSQKVSCYYVNTAQKIWHEFLVCAGLTPAKSKTIKEVLVPEELFAHFIRGLFDGDGTSYSFRDRRYPNAFNIYIEFATASSAFALWIKERLRELYGVKAIIKKGKGVLIVRLFKGDSKFLFEEMYRSADGCIRPHTYCTP